MASVCCLAWLCGRLERKVTARIPCARVGLAKAGQRGEMRIGPAATKHGQCNAVGQLRAVNVAKSCTQSIPATVSVVGLGTHAIYHNGIPNG